MEFNKIFAAILVAAIVASLAGFVANKLVHPHQLQETAYHIEGVESVGGAAAGPTGPEPIMALLAAADVAKGEKISRACAACHSFDKGGATGTGPNLWNVMTRGVATVGFDYSEGMKAHGGKWTYDALNHFLWKPKAIVEGTKMNFIGLKKPEDRAAVIAWLRTLADAPPALPGAAEIAAEEAALNPAPAEDALPADEAAAPADAPEPGATEDTHVPAAAHH